jgi:hypothetical protein
MRTKSILLGAAIMAAGVASSMAANVYSVNVVGYVTVSLTNGFTMISNPLDFDGTGTNNSLNTVLSNAVPDLTAVYKFSGGTFGGASFSFGGQWFPNQTLNPGEGAFINNTSGNPLTVTFVGTVITNSSLNIVPGFSISSSKMPITGGVGTTLNLTNMTDLDSIYTWNTTNQTYNGASFSFGGSWFPEPVIAPGQSFFIQAASSKNWVQAFSVN